MKDLGPSLNIETAFLLPMFDEEIPPIAYTVSFDQQGMRMFYDHLLYAIERWPGSPARPAMEQEFLWKLRDDAFSALLEHTFELPSQDR